ncbi:hypothetical protein MKD49_20305 [Herbaspirillum sp. WGmk3]|uniref:ABC-three component system middle component 4 n=1 Tax=Herbaspirillum sp. WGmk3 TaxID=2919925 RepID=UPI002091DE16|nr:ABC-three component system middle component 4 [Herbaspirillum sp. WGmk3]MCO4858843.1 hypothetical protein [Herbaspirillum sp. WGmk3]
MSNLPYLVPDQDGGLNLATMMIILLFLAKTDRGKKLINNERLLIFMYLLRNPIVLNKVLEQIGKDTVALSENERYSIGGITVNLDPLFDSNWIKRILQEAAGRGLLEVTYRKTEGFMYSLSHTGIALANNLNGDYFDRLRIFSKSLQQVNSETTKNLNVLLNNVFRA